MAGEFLLVTDGNAAGAEIGLEDELLIGRTASGEGSLGDDPELSREHARITRTGDGDVLIEDLDSTNGTSVNGDRITEPTTIRSGDEISVGNTTLKVGGTAAVAPTAVRTTVPSPPPPQQTSVRPRPEAGEPAGRPEAPAPPPPAGAPPPGAGAPPPRTGAQPPEAGGQPQGVGGPPVATGAVPPAPAPGGRQATLLAALGGFVAGFVIAAVIFGLL